MADDTTAIEKYEALVELLTNRLRTTKDRFDAVRRLFPDAKEAHREAERNLEELKKKLGDEKTTEQVKVVFDNSTRLTALNTTDRMRPRRDDPPQENCPVCIGYGIRNL
jgi:phage shock protein A